MINSCIKNINQVVRVDPVTKNSVLQSYWVITVLINKRKNNKNKLPNKMLK